MATERSDTGGAVVPSPFPLFVSVPASSLAAIDVGGETEAACGQAGAADKVCRALSRPFAEASGGETVPSLAGVGRNDGRLVLNVMHTDRHSESDLDWNTQESIRYSLRRSGSSVVARPLLRSESALMGPVCWHGSQHDSLVAGAWNAMVAAAGEGHGEEAAR